MSLYSPKGREVRDLHGEPGAIRQRGNEITSLGEQMSSSAVTLKNLATDADGMKGESAKKIQEIVGDCYNDLDKAAKLYTPVGPVLTGYAATLEYHQPLIRQRATDCEDAHNNFVSAPGYLEGERPFWDRERGDSPEEKEAREDQEDQDAAKQQLKGAYDDALRAFDIEVDSWETAFNDAADKMEAAFENGIKDGFWDNVDGFVAGALTVLKYAGMVLAVAAIIIGGPIIGAIAAVVAVATLVLTIYSFARGHSSKTDLALAIVGVIPFGSVGKLAQGRRGMIEFAGDAFPAFKPSTWSAAATEMRTIGSVATFASNGGGRFSGFVQGAKRFATGDSPRGVWDIVSRAVVGKNTDDFGDAIRAVAGARRGYCVSTTIPAAIDMAVTLRDAKGKVSGYYDSVRSGVSGLRGFASSGGGWGW